MPKPKSADMRCSTVETRAPSCSRTVAMVVVVTLVARAGMAGLTGKSERQKTMPVSTGAGRITITTLWPVCRPTPVARTAVFKVRCLIISLIISDCYARVTGGERGPAGVLGEPGHEVARRERPGE